MRNSLNIVKNKIKSFPPVVWMLVVLIIVFSIASPDYFALHNFQNIIIQSVPLLILALGQTLIVLTQGTDLSLGAQVSFTTVLWILLAKKGIPLIIGIPIVLAATAFVGMVNGAIVAYGKIPPFIATLGMQNILNSISLLLTAGSSIYFSSQLFRWITDTKVLFLPFPILIAAIVLIALWLVLNRTKLGIHIKTLGGNPEALSLAGVKMEFSLIQTYTLVGFVAGIAGIVTACRVESGQPIVGLGWEFDAVAATLLGGTSLREGRGGIIGTIFGVLLIKMLQNGLNMSGVRTIYQNATIGFIVLVAIILDALIKRKQAVDGADV